MLNIVKGIETRILHDLKISEKEQNDDSSNTLQKKKSKKEKMTKADYVSVYSDKAFLSDMPIGSFIHALSIISSLVSEKQLMIRIEALEEIFNPKTNPKNQQAFSQIGNLKKALASSNCLLLEEEPKILPVKKSTQKKK
ncbi:MAG TPA: hypothetical protein VI959_03960 [Alphaproteobacteria bacterium]|nr:hypothetical protein [Alphaproteobacteria bacterium]